MISSVPGVGSVTGLAKPPLSACRNLQPAEVCRAIWPATEARLWNSLPGPLHCFGRLQLRSSRRQPRLRSANKVHCADGSEWAWAVADESGGRHWPPWAKTRGSAPGLMTGKGMAMGLGSELLAAAAIFVLLLMLRSHTDMPKPTSTDAAVIEAFRRIRRRQGLTSVPLAAAFLFLEWRRAHSPTGGGADLFLLLIVVAAAGLFTYRNWRCPRCGAYPRKYPLYRGVCPKCGTALREPTQQVCRHHAQLRSRSTCRLSSEREVRDRPMHGQDRENVVRSKVSRII